MGIDVGGTNIKFGLVDRDGETLAVRTTPTNVEAGPEEACSRIASEINALCDENRAKTTDVAGIGLAVPGIVDLEKGVLLAANNFPGWENFPLRDRVAGKTRLPVVLHNDANAAAYGEYWLGSGKNFRSMVMLTLGTGVGGGVILNGQLLTGDHGLGAEVGNILIDHHPNARKCGGGYPGRLEAYASATGLVGRVLDRLQVGEEGALYRDWKNGVEVTAHLVYQHAGVGDPFAVEMVNETARYLGVGIVTLMHTLDPSAVVLGGAMTFGGGADPVGRHFLDRIRQEVAQRAFPQLVEEVVIDFAALGSQAGYLGAAGLALAAFGK